MNAWKSMNTNQTIHFRAIIGLFPEQWAKIFHENLNLLCFQKKSQTVQAGLFI